MAHSTFDIFLGKSKARIRRITLIIFYNLEYSKYLIRQSSSRELGTDVKNITKSRKLNHLINNCDVCVYCLLHAELVDSTSNKLVTW